MITIIMKSILIDLLPLMFISRLSIVFLMLLWGCGPAADVSDTSPAVEAANSSPATENASWPRTIQTSSGPLILDAQPRRIVSTSVTLTGSLLAIQAPVVASATVRHSGGVTDEQGFFSQWGAIASQRGVKPLYQGEVNADAVLAMQPDLIVVSATGGDSALKAKDLLETIAPVLVVNYDDRSWQDVATLLGQATGHEADARHIIADFQHQIDQLRQHSQLPRHPITAMVYNEDGSGANIWTHDSAQGRLLSQIGLTLAPVPDDVQQQSVALGRRDILPVSGERFSQALTGQSLLLFATGDETVPDVLHNPLLAALPAVRQQQVYALGADTFRLDYYSARHVLERLAQVFGPQG